MTAREYIRLIDRAEYRVAAKKERLHTLHEMATAAGSSAPTGMPHNPSPSPSRMENVICKAADLENEIEQEQSKIQEMRLYLLDRIGSLVNVEYQRVLTYRYVKGLSWEDTVTTLGLSRRWVFSLHHAAMDELDAVFEREQTVFLPD